MANDINNFDARAKAWDTPEKIARSKALSDAIAALLPVRGPLKAMEFGCGTGLLSFGLSDHFERITLVDTSAGMLEVLREKIEQSGAVHFKPVLRDIFTDPFEQEFDVIYTAMTLHHIPDARSALNVFARSLAPGGILFIADLDKEDGSFHRGDETVHHGFERDELFRMANEVGFSNILFSTAYEMVKIKDPFFKQKYTIFLMRATR